MYSGELPWGSWKEKSLLFPERTVPLHTQTRGGENIYIQIHTHVFEIFVTFFDIAIFEVMVTYEENLQNV